MKSDESTRNTMSGIVLVFVRLRLIPPSNGSGWFSFIDWQGWDIIDSDEWEGLRRGRHETG